MGAWRPRRVLIGCACVLECILVGPNVAAEVVLARANGDGLGVTISRLCLFAARLAFVVNPLSDRLRRRCGERVQRHVQSASQFCVAFCGSVAPSRGIATVLAGWYLIATPMHDAFGALEWRTSSDGVQSDDSGSKASIAPSLMVPCACMMLLNVLLFLCDAVILTLYPMIRPGPDVAPKEAVAHARVFTFGDAPADPAGKEYSPTCVVCLGDFEVGESVAQLPCRHTFHTKCVSEWLAGHQTCPMRCPGLVEVDARYVAQLSEGWPQPSPSTPSDDDGGGGDVEDAVPEAAPAPLAAPRRRPAPLLVLGADDEGVQSGLSDAMVTRNLLAGEQHSWEEQLALPNALPSTPT